MCEVRGCRDKSEICSAVVDNVSKLPQTADHQVHPGYPEGCVERYQGITMMSSTKLSLPAELWGFVKLQNSLTNDVVSVGLRAS